MDIRQLRYFKTIAELGSLTKAAEQLRISQPALTRQIQSLERDMGVDLFFRHSRGLELTSAGALLLQRAERVMAELDLIRRDVAAPKEIISPLRIGIATGAAQQLVGAMVSELRRRSGTAEIYISELGVSRLLAELREGALDLAITHHARAAHGCYSAPIITETLMLISSPDSWLGEEIDAEELLDLPLVTVGSRDNLHQFISSMFASRRRNFCPALEVSGYDALKSLLKSGGLYGFLSENAVCDEIRRGELAATRIANLNSELRLDVVSRRDFRTCNTMRFLVATARRKARELVHSHHWKGELAS
jgi:DNA-binding transcriptional LysR family regulator